MSNRRYILTSSGSIRPHYSRRYRTLFWAKRAAAAMNRYDVSHPRPVDLTPSEWYVTVDPDNSIVLWTETQYNAKQIEYKRHVTAFPKKAKNVSVVSR